MLPRAPEISDHGINRDGTARARGSDTGSTQTSSRLPPQTHHIMETFLSWNTTNNATKYEQKKREAVQLRILSRLQRPRSVGQPREEVRALAPGKPQASASQHQKRPAGGVPSSSASVGSRGSMGSRNGNGNNQHGVHSHTVTGPNSSASGGRMGSMGSRNGNGNHKHGVNSHTVPSRSVASSPHPGGSISGSLGSPNGDENKTNVGFRTNHPLHLEDPSVTDRSIASPSHRGRSMPDSFRNEITPNRKATNPGSQISHGQNTHPSTFRAINNQIDEDEEDIVCCDCCDGGHYHEGTKNLCTIALWAFILLFICNRFFLHFAMHLNKNEAVTVTLKQMGDVPTGSEVDNVEIMNHGED